MAATLDRYGQLALMDRAVAGDAARDDLATLGHKPAEHPLIFEIDEMDLILAEAADFATALPISVFWSFSHLYLSLQFVVFNMMTRFEAVRGCLQLILANGGRGLLTAAGRS